MLASSFRCLVFAVALAGVLPGQADAAWITATHPCPGGNRTDALHRDSDGTLWVGCGTNATGYGLFYSENGGANWSPAAVSPADALNEFRVNSISRGHDGALYVAGFRASTRDMVLRFNTASSPFVVTITLQGINQVGRSFHVGTYRELSDGRAIAESLNGVDLLYRPTSSTGSGAADWTRVQDLTRQILDMAVHEDRFYGVGGLINAPPSVFLPPTVPGAAPYEFNMQVPTVAAGWEGELWGMAISAQRLVAVGVDQDADVGKILVSGANPAAMGSYIEHELPDIVGPGGIGTWARGVCMRGDQVVVVGERQPLSSGNGLVMRSTNGGQSFTAIPPPGVTASVSKCVIEPDGTVVVAGAAGFIGIYESAMDNTLFANGFEGN
ncbi:hypothetical protein OS187_03390 [Xanthomonadaceae bacterium JHOS43]|nr:hypothetical protein [Xanthomonadaceae bacterium JHOS43]